MEFGLKPSPNPPQGTRIPNGPPAGSLADEFERWAVRLRGVFQPRLSILAEYIYPPRVLERRRAELCVVSYPKTGRTWLRMMLKSALHQHLGVPRTDPLEFHELTRADARVPRIAVVHDDEPHWKKPDQLTTNKRPWYGDKRVLLVIRDPRDTMVSLYFQMARRWRVFPESEKSLSEFIWQERGALKSMIRYYNIWAENRRVPAGLCLVRYEGLQQKPIEEIQRALRFIGIADIPRATLAAAVEENRIERIRLQEQAHEYGTRRLRPGIAGDPESFKARRGKVRGFVDYLDRADIEKISRLIRDELDPWYGYKELVEPLPDFA